MKRQIFLLFAICFILMTSAAASDSATPLKMQIKDTKLTLYTGFSRAVDLSFTPASVEVGIDCGMPDMCGLDPCTCGKSDQWGECSCNGLKTVTPDVTVSSENGKIANAVYRDGKVKISASKAGTATVKVTAKLQHYGSAQDSIEVTVLPIPAVWYLLAGSCLVIIAVLLLIFVRKMRKRQNYKPNNNFEQG